MHKTINMKEAEGVFIHDKPVDIHLQTAMRMFGCSAEAITPEMRREAKNANFLMIYGGEKAAREFSRKRLMPCI